MAHILLAGGGTAGHINPLIATARALESMPEQHTIYAAGTPEGLEVSLIPQTGLTLELIDKVPFPRSLHPRSFAFPLHLWKTVARARSILRERSIDVVCGFGGFVSSPFYLAARSLSLPIVIHEQNAKPGMANKLGARWAQAVGLTFPGTPLRARTGTTSVIGLPMRPEIITLARELHEDPQGRRAQAAQYFGCSSDAPTLVVTGGSLGALALNNLLDASLEQFLDAGVQVIHLTGRGKAARAYEKAQKYPSYVVKEYETHMEEAYAIADAIVCRSGAGTVAEVSALRIPALYVPLAIGNGEQALNCEASVRVGASKRIRETELTAAFFSAAVLPMLTDSEIHGKMSSAAEGLSPLDAAQQCARLILEAAHVNSRGHRACGSVKKSQEGEK